MYIYAIYYIKFYGKKWRGRIRLLKFEAVGQEEFIFIHIAIISQLQFEFAHSFPQCYQNKFSTIKLVRLQTYLS